MWQYVRDVFIVLALLLLFSGLVVGWWLFCLCGWLIGAGISLLLDLRQAWGDYRGRK